MLSEQEVKYPVELPDKLSELIQLALDDLIKCEKSKKYNVNMQFWHQPGLHGTCSVCFAGSVMAKETAIKTSDAASQYVFGGKNATKFMALSGIAVAGGVEEELHRRYGGSIPEARELQAKFFTDILSYRAGKGKWKRWVRKVIKVVQKFEQEHPNRTARW